MSEYLDQLFAQYKTHLSVTNLASILGVTQKTAYDYLQAGDIPAYRIGSKWIILRDEVRDHMRKSAISPPDPFKDADSSEGD